MERLRNMLAAKAAAVVPGPGYNAYRGAQQDSASGCAVPLFFESALPAAEPEKNLVGQVVPSLMRFLHRKKQSLDSPRNVLVALFLGETCFVLTAETVLDLFCEIEDTTRQGLRLRVLDWIDG